VGSGACASCHAREDAAWRESDHFLAMQEASDRTVLGDFGNARFTHEGFTSTFFRRDGGFFVNTEGPDGALHDYRVRYTFGVRPLQQYLIEFPDGRLQALGIAWDARDASLGGRRWFDLYAGQSLKPGDALHWTGIDEAWNYQCAECHSTDLRRGYDPATRAYHTTFAEINVACESCHGPGSAHVAWAKAGGTPDDGGSMGLAVRYRDRRGVAWVMDAATGIAHRSGTPAAHDEVEACAFCHARRGVLREGFVPGRPIGDTHRVALLEPGLYHADGQIDGEVYEYGSFTQSRMYRAGVTCSDCHDPHTGRRYAEGNELCARCHLTSKFDTPDHHHHRADSPGARCTACHMLERTYMGVDVRRDHSFRAPRPDLTLELGTPSTCTDCHSDRGARWSQEAFFGWWGKRERPHYAAALAPAREGAPGAADALAKLVRDPTVPEIARATAIAHLAAYPSPALAPVIVAGAADPAPRVREAAAATAAALSPNDRAATIAPLLTDPVLAVRIEAGRALADVPAEALKDGGSAARDSALAEYRRAQMVNADRPEAWLNLGNLDAQSGRSDAAERAFRRAIELDATWEPAYANLADALRAAGRDDEGERVLRAGIARLPAAAELHHALGLLEVRRKRLAAALPLLARAVELAPDNPRLAYVYAVALVETGEAHRARDVTEAALARSPYNEALRQLRSELEP
jgi:Flp pilus assembly protein TadD